MPIFVLLYTEKMNKERGKSQDFVGLVRVVLVSAPNSLNIDRLSYVCHDSEEWQEKNGTTAS